MNRRSTSDLVMLILTISVGLFMLTALIMVGIIQAVSPEADLTSAVSALSHIITIIVGCVVGYLAGKGRTDDHAG
jgi:uncharacterized membrane protein (DUF441 family)